MRLIYSSNRTQLQEAVIQRVQEGASVPPRLLCITESGTRVQVIQEKVLKQTGISPAVVTWDQLIRIMHPFLDSRVLLSQTDALPFVLRAWWELNPHFKNRLVLPTGLLRRFYRFFELWTTLPQRQQEVLMEQESERLTPLLRLYHQYQTLIADQYIDRFQLLHHLKQDDVRRHPHWQHIQTIMVEVTHPLRPIYRDILSHWDALGLDVAVALHYGPNTACFEDMEDTFQWARRQATTVDPIPNPFPVVENFLQMEATTVPASHLFLTAQPHRLGEAAWVARKIRQLAVDKGIPLEHMAITAMDFPRYYPIITNTLQEYAIPLTESSTRPLMENPVVGILLQFVKAIASEEEVSSLIPLLESQYLTYHHHLKGLDVPDILAELRLPGNVEALRHQARLMQQYFSTSLPEDEVPTQEELRQYKQLEAALQELGEDMERFAACQTPSDYVQFFLNFIERHQLLESSVKHRVKHQPRQAVENFRALREWIQTLDTWQKRHPELTLNAIEFFQILQLLVETTSITLPGPAAGGVQVVPPDHLPNQNFSVVFVLGMSDANFPQGTSSFLQGIPETLQRLLSREATLRQRRWFTSLVENPSQLIFFTYPLREKESEQIPSLFVQELQRIHTVIVVKKTPPVPDPAEWQQYQYQRFLKGELSTPQQNSVVVPVPVDRIAHAVKIFTVQESLDQAPGQHEGNIHFKSFEGVLQERIRGRLFSVSALESFAWCPMQYFLRYELHIPDTEPRKDFLSPLERGNFVHTVLYRFYTELDADHRTAEALLAIAEDELHRLPLPGNFIREFLKREFITGNTRTSVFREAFDRLQKLDEQFQEMGLTEVMAEQAFGFSTTEKPHTWPEFTLPYGESTIRFRGKIDRINSSPGGEFAVIDYKTGKAPSGSDIYQGLKLQLPLYIRAVQQLNPGTPIPLGGGYVEIRRNGSSNTLQLLEVDGKTRIKDEKKHPLSLEEVIQRTENFVQQYLAEMEKGHFTHTTDPGRCGNCNYRYLCRRYPPKQRARQRQRSE